MAAVTNSPLCTVKYCPAPSDPDWHHCLVTGSNVIEHHHVEGRGKVRTMDKKKVVPLAPQIHKNISLNEWGDAILDLDGSKTYRIWNLKNEAVHEGVHWWMQNGRRFNDGAEEGDSPAGDFMRLPSTPASAPSLKEESDERNADEEHNQGLSGRQREGSAAETMADAPNIHTAHRGASGIEHRPSSLTHEQRVAIAQQIKDAEWGRQWIAGDTGNAWIAELGEEAEQYLSGFGYVHESLSNILRVCAAIPPPYRNGNLRYSHHVVVYQLSREDQVLRLKECEDEGWSVAEFRRQVHGEPEPRVKQWPMSELLEGLEEWPHPTDRPRPKGAVRAYLMWLGER